MGRRNLKAKLLLFFARKLRRWANSIERNVSQRQPNEETVDRVGEDFEQAEDSNSALDKDTTADAMNQGGPPQHWIDLVKEKAPELLSLPRANSMPSRSFQHVSPTNVGSPHSHDRKELQESEKRVLQESQPKTLMIDHAELQSATRPPSRAKNKSFSLSKFLRLVMPAKVTPPVPPLEKPRNREAVSTEEPSAIFTRNQPTEKKGEALVFQPRLPIRPKQRRGHPDQPTVDHTRSSSDRTSRSKDVKSSKTEVPPKAVSLATDYRYEQAMRRANRPPSSPPDTLSPASHGSRAEELRGSPRSVGRSDTPAPGLQRERRRNKRVSVALTPSQTKKSTQSQSSFPEMSSPIRLQESYPGANDGKGTAPVLSFRTLTSQLTPPHQLSPARFERAQGNAPALTDEGTMSGAAIVHWNELSAGENPWPDLPSASSLEIADELLANERELDRYRRLEREQRGALWNE